MKEQELLKLQTEAHAMRAQIQHTLDHAFTPEEKYGPEWNAFHDCYKIIDELIPIVDRAAILFAQPEPTFLELKELTMTLYQMTTLVPRLYLAHRKFRQLQAEFDAQ